MSGAVRVAVIADTHLPRRGPSLPPACVERLRGAGLIVHAGDLSDMGTLRMLRGLGPPVVAVRGNVEEREVRALLPETALVEAGGLRLGVVHDAGAAAGRLERMRRRFPGAAGVVFGHSHIPLLARAEDGFFILNPGSPTDRRRSPRHTMAEITLDPDGGPPSIVHLAVDDPAGPLDPGLVRSA